MVPVVDSRRRYPPLVIFAVALGLSGLASFGCGKKAPPLRDADPTASGSVVDSAVPPAATVAAASFDAGDPDAATILGLLGGLDPDSGLGAFVGYGEFSSGGSGSPPPREPILVRESSLSVAGTLDASIIRRLLKRSTPRFNFCQRESLKRNASPSGRVDFKVTVGAKGRVNEVTIVQKTLDDPMTLSCLVSAFKTLMFPEVAGDTVFSYGLLLLPPDAK